MMTLKKITIVLLAIYSTTALAQENYISCEYKRLSGKNLANASLQTEVKKVKLLSIAHKAFEQKGSITLEGHNHPFDIYVNSQGLINLSTILDSGEKVSTLGEGKVNLTVILDYDGQNASLSCSTD